MTFHVLSAGAVKGLVEALRPRFSEAHKVEFACAFGAVGAMREKLVSGDRCDVIVLTQAMISSLAEAGIVMATTIRSLGVVATGIAFRKGNRMPPIGTQGALRQALLVATSIHFPDPAKATAGIHFAKVLRTLAVQDDVVGRIRTYPNGAAAMAALADAQDLHPIGCTQVTEILYTPGVALAGSLPPGLELATRYDAAASSRAAAPPLAEQFVTLLSGPSTQALRAAGGFED